MSSDPEVPAQPELTALAGSAAATAGDLDVERDSDVPISTQIYWQIAYQIDSVGCSPAPVWRRAELGAALRVNPNTIRAVYKRLADAGYVTSRHGAGTHVADRPPQRRGAIREKDLLVHQPVREFRGGGRIHPAGGRRPRGRGDQADTVPRRQAIGDHPRGLIDAAEAGKSVTAVDRTEGPVR